MMMLIFPAHATELVWDGFYRGRGLLYDSLSLSDSNTYAEGTSNFFDHRLLLKPTWNISDHAAVKARVDFFPLVTWGESADTYTDPVTGETTALATADGVGAAATSFRAVQAWGEAYTTIGDNPIRFAMGRMPMEWGAGILWNPGDELSSEYGDSADRIMASGRFGQVFTMAAWDVQYEGYLGVPDDMQALSFAVGYRGETAGAGLLNNYRWQPSFDYKAYTADVWGFVQAGALNVELEGVGVFGGGDLDTGANDIGVMAFGVMARADWASEKLGWGAEVGLATGDADTTDEKIRTFSFDRDHNLSLILFEQALPTLEATVIAETNGGRTTEAALTGDGISNALYLRPSVRYRFFPTVTGELSWLTASRAKGAEGEPRGYGNEIDLSLHLEPHPHVSLSGTAGVMLPGKVYSTYEDEDLGGGFNQPALALQVMGAVEF